jgi:hypothetical protein
VSGYPRSSIDRELTTQKVAIVVSLPFGTVIVWTTIIRTLVATRMAFFGYHSGVDGQEQFEIAPTSSETVLHWRGLLAVLPK